MTVAAASGHGDEGGSGGREHHAGGGELRAGRLGRREGGGTGSRCMQASNGWPLPQLWAGGGSNGSSVSVELLNAFRLLQLLRLFGGQLRRW